MKALICDSFDGIAALRLGQLPEPELAPGTALITVEAATVGFADTLMVAGQYQFRPETPFAPGFEIAGTIEAVMGLDDYSVGDRVAAFMWAGGMAEKALATSANMIRLPDGIPAEIGATLTGGYGTAYHALVDRARLQAEETLLVLGAAGGVGIPAVQLGKALGARVIGAVSSDEKEQAVRRAGADEVIRYDRTSLRDGIKTITGGGVDVVFDPVGGEMTEQALRSTNWRGRLLIVGFASGSIPKLPANLSLVKGNSIVGVFWGRFTTEEPELSRANNQRIIEMVERGDLTPEIQTTFDLDRARDALQWVADRKVIGRVIVKP
jgi:NADPH2:quinone reductase